MTFLNEVFERIENVNPLDYPEVPGEPSPVEDGETVVGEATEDIKKIIIARHLVREELDDLDTFQDEEQLKETLGQMTVNAAQEYIGERRKKLSRIDKLLDVINILLWSTIKDECDIWGENVGFRDGWKIVTFESTGLPSFLNIG